jgi:tRNA modification GTPase
VRLSGPSAPAIAMRMMARDRALEPRHATLGSVRTAVSADQIVATLFPAPGSYTGDDVVEIAAHGSPVILRGIVQASIGLGARLAEPGEFTLRAFVNGRIDLPQAEAVADLIDAVTPLQARAAFDQLEGTLTRTIGEIDRRLFDLIAQLEASVDFPEEGYHFGDPLSIAAEIDAIGERAAALLAQAGRGRLVRDGLQVAIVGPPNAGKSSLFNVLVGSDRAIVAEIPGTTRDLVSETIDLEGVRVTLVDTAGLRETDEPVESEGIARTLGAMRVADLILVVSDRSQPIAPVVLPANIRRLTVLSKCDLPRSKEADASVNAQGPDAVEVSVRTMNGIDGLRRRIATALDAEPIRDIPEITNVRHIALVERAHAALIRAREAALSDGQSLPEEFVLADLQEARAALEEITGKRASGDLLAHIFSRFCIGK